MRSRAERTAAAERRARAAGLRRDGSQRPVGRVTRCALPGERPGHQVTTAHFQAVYPAVAEAGLGSEGVYIGRDMHGGSFVYDPWVLYARGVLNDANTLVIGRPDFGKSSLSKTWLMRSRVFGRRGEIVDLKGEYDPLVTALGGTILRLTPGGGTRLNPLTRIGRRELREGLLEAIARAMLARPLSQAEAIGLSGPSSRRTAAAMAPRYASRTSSSSCVHPAASLLTGSAPPAVTCRASCGRSRSRCSASATGRCAGCSTGRPAPARTSWTRR